MQFRDLKAQYVALKEKIDTGIQEVLNDGNFIMGKQVTELEKKLAEYVGVKHCISCANGTDALTMVLMAWDIKEGDAVFIPDFTFFASGEVVSYEGATPIFVDVEEKTFNIDAVKLELAIERVISEGKLKPRAIIAVDLFGLPANYDEIERIAKKYNLLVLEDSAQGFGGAIGDRKACSFGDAATTSFFPAKPLGCYGDGGAVFTNDDKVAEYLNSIRFHGKGNHKYNNVRIGINSRLDTIQASILLPKLDALKDSELDAVNRVARKYTEKLKNIAKTPEIPEGFYSSWAQYTLVLENQAQRDGMIDALKGKGIPTMVYYPRPMHTQGAFEYLPAPKNDLSTTQMLCECVVSLPMHPYMKDEDIEKVSNAVIEYLK